MLTLSAQIEGEVLNALKGLKRSGQMSPADADSTVRRLVSAAARRWSGRDLAGAAWGLGHRLSAYDAMYVALASILACPVLTVDRRWQRAGDLGVTVLTVS